MLPEFGFFPPPREVREINLRGIDDLILPPGSETWVFEEPTKTIVGGGAGRFVFSGKRLSFTSFRVRLRTTAAEPPREGGGTEGRRGEGLYSLFAKV